MFAEIITSELENICNLNNLLIVNGLDYLEILSSKVNKGIISSFIVKELLSSKIDFDFFACFGDDIADENMFKYTKHMKSRKDIENVYSIIISKKPSNAMYYLNSQESTYDLLAMMSRQGN